MNSQVVECSRVQTPQEMEALLSKEIEKSLSLMEELEELKQSQETLQAKCKSLEE